MALTCYECGCPLVGPTCPSCNEAFVPCAVYYAETDHTEIVLRDCVTVYHPIGPDTEAGYDMETGELVVIRVPGDVTLAKLTPVNK